MVHLSWSIDRSLPDFLRLYGTEGEARIGWRASAWRRHGQDWRVLGDGYAKVPAMRGALLQFCRAVRGHETTTVTDGVADALVIDACYESLRRGSWVKVTERAP
jgi:predicted dehydrogenase